MKTKFLLIFAAMVIGSFTTACGQITGSGYMTSISGLEYKFHRESKSPEKPQVGDILTVKMNYFINDSLLFESSSIGKVMQFPLVAPAFKGDFFEGISMMSAGDSASFLNNADSVFYKIFRVKSLPDFVKPNSVMRFEVSLDTFVTQAAFEAQKMAESQELVDESNSRMKQYIADKGITAVPQESGLVYIETKEGEGAKPENGQKVRVHYLGTLLDGTKFDSSFDRNEPIEFTLGVGQVIKGWDEGISLMRVGGKATLLIPFNLAYGERATGPIPAFSPLIFEVELVEIIK